jgi:hypothetical protein
MNEEKWKLVDEKIKAKLTILSENSRAKVCSTNCLVDETMMVISEIYHSEIEQAEKEKERQVLNDRYAGFVEAENTLKLEGAERLAERIDKNCELYEKPISNTECELMIRHDDIKKQLSELKKELEEK